MPETINAALLAPTKHLALNMYIPLNNQYLTVANQQPAAVNIQPQYCAE
jgi:hypothetical protein